MLRVRRQETPRPPGGDVSSAVSGLKVPPSSKHGRPFAVIQEFSGADGGSCHHCNVLPDLLRPASLRRRTRQPGTIVTLNGSRGQRNRRYQTLAPCVGPRQRPVSALATGEFQPASWSRDGKWMAFLRMVNGVRQIFVAPVRDGTPDTSAARQSAVSRFNQEGAEFLPDGRWIAYTSNESGAGEVYVLPFPGPGERRRLSSSGGSNPVWSADGRELFFTERRPGERRAMMAMDVSTVGEFTAVFRTHCSRRPSRTPRRCVVTTSHPTASSS